MELKNFIRFPTQEQRDRMCGIYKEEGKSCPKCGKQLFRYDGGNQGGVPYVFCKECNYEKY